MRYINLITFSLLLVTLAVANINQEAVQARFMEIENELDRAEVSMQINKLGKQISLAIAQAKMNSIAMLPCRNSDGKRTELTEFMDYNLGMEFKNQTNCTILSPDQVSSHADHQESANHALAGREASALAHRLSVQGILCGTIAVGSEKIISKYDYFDTAGQSAIRSFSIQLPKSEEIMRMDRNALEVTQIESPAKPEPSDAPHSADRPSSPPAEPSPTSASPSYQKEYLESAIEIIAQQLATTSRLPNETKVGILDFPDLQNRITQLSRYITEELTTDLFAKMKFNLVERNLLDQVMREHRLAQTGLIDIALAQEIGKALGADAIVTGSLSDMGQAIKINARLIHVGQGNLLAVASASILKTPGVVEMYSKIVQQTPVNQPLPPSRDSAPNGATLENVYYEDFQNVQDGALPSRWIGGEKLMVKSENNRKFVTNFENEHSHSFTIDNLAFPDDYELQSVVRFGNDASNTHYIIRLPNIKIIIDVFGWCQMNDSKTEKRNDLRNKTAKVILRKTGPIYRLLVNGEEMLMTRYSDAPKPQAVTFEFQNMNGFRLLEIIIKQV